MYFVRIANKKTGEIREQEFRTLRAMLTKIGWMLYLVGECDRDVLSVEIVYPDWNRRRLD